MLCKARESGTSVADPTPWGSGLGPAAVKSWGEVRHQGCCVVELPREADVGQNLHWYDLEILDSDHSLRNVVRNPHIFRTRVEYRRTDNH